MSAKKTTTTTTKRPFSKEFANQILNWLQQQIGRKPYLAVDLLVATQLTTHCNEAEGGRAFPSYKTIGEPIGVSERTVMRSIDRMKAHGDLHVIPGRPGRGHPNQYFPIFKPAEKTCTQAQVLADRKPAHKTCTQAQENLPSGECYALPLRKKDSPRPDGRAGECEAEDARRPDGRASGHREEPGEIAPNLDASTAAGASAHGPAGGDAGLCHGDTKPGPGEGDASTAGKGSNSTVAAADASTAATAKTENQGVPHTLKPGNADAATPAASATAKADQVSRAHLKPENADATLDTAFAEWWRQCPKRVGQADARRAYMRIVRKGEATPAELLAGMMRYAAECEGRESRWIKNPANWLRGGHWTDEPAKPAQQKTHPAIVGVNMWLAEQRAMQGNGRVQ